MFTVALTYNRLLLIFALILMFLLPSYAVQTLSLVSVGFAKEYSYKINIAGHSFDPKVDKVGPTDWRLSKEELTAYRLAPNYYLVQLHQPINRKSHKRLQEEYGLRLQGYIPELTYLERLQEDTFIELSQDDAVRTIVPFEPVFKVSPNIGKIKFRSEERKSLAESGLFC